jgi:hypothetical protein
VAAQSSLTNLALISAQSLIEFVRRRRGQSGSLNADFNPLNQQVQATPAINCDLGDQRAAPDEASAASFGTMTG